MSNLSELLGGGGGAELPGDIRRSYATDADMADAGFLPATGGAVTQAGNPKLFAGIGHRYFGATEVVGPNWTFSDGSNISSNSCVVVDSVNDKAFVTGGSGSHYFRAVNLATGASISQVYLDSYVAKALNIFGTDIYVGGYKGKVWRFTAPNYNTAETVQFSLENSNNWDVHAFLVHGGYVFAATQRGIRRLTIGNAFNNEANWPFVYDQGHSMGAPTVSGGELPGTRFYVDPVTGYIFCHYGVNNYMFRSTDGGATWTGGSFINTGMVGPVRWGDNLYCFERATPWDGNTTPVPELADSRVVRSTDDGATWHFSSMYLRCLGKWMVPFVRGGLLFYGQGVVDIGTLTIRTLQEEKAGLQLPEPDNVFSNVRSIIDVPIQKGFTGNNGMIVEDGSAFGVRAVYPSMSGSSNSYVTDRKFIPSCDMDTEMTLPEILLDPPTFIKAG
jgi:hypothetical protein